MVITITVKKFLNYTFFFKSPPDLPYNIEFIWLGQAGFAFQYQNLHFIIDPYLSDYLAKKYHGKIFPHIRLMAIPILPNDISKCDFVLSSHPHSDHMDPETLTILSSNHPACWFIIPAAAKDEGINRGINPNQIIPARIEEPITIIPKITIIPIPAAHEEFQINSAGEHTYLGFILKCGNLTFYHSGDCVPYSGLSHLLQKYRVDVAFLPINGRDEYRLSHNIAGNFHVSEVLELCKDAYISQLIVHHFGMFSYNTVSDQVLTELKTKSTSDLNITIPEIFYKYTLYEK
jgi:L-ascorbate metabolism protein UlaG (beta-lactamase superfamily)